MAIMHLTKADDIPFVQLPRETLKSELSCDALALYCYLSTHGASWKIHASDAEKRFGWGEKRRKDAFRELEQAGYLTAHKVHDSKGQFKVDWTLRAVPASEGERTKLTTTTNSPPTNVGEPTPTRPRVGATGGLHDSDSHDSNSSNTDKERIRASPISASSESDTERRKNLAHPRAAETDRRKDHPAIVAVRGVLSRYPNKEQWPGLIAALGDRPDVARLRRCYDEWVLHGWKPLNLVWATKWYLDGPPGGFTATTPEEIKAKSFWKNIP